MLLKSIMSAAAVMLLSQNAVAKQSAKVEPKNVKYILNYILEKDQNHLKTLSKELDADLKPYRVLDLGKRAKKEELQQVSDEVYRHFVEMDRLDKKADYTENFKFMKSLDQNQIRRIYFVRNLYDRFSPIGGYEKGPALRTTQMQGIFQGRSSLGLENQRSFQKAFYTLKDSNGQEYAAGHNISYTPLWVGSQGSFRIYEDKYPIYSRDNKAKWKRIADGSVSLSYQRQDMEPLEGARLNNDYPITTYYRWYFNKKDKRRLSLTRTVYANLKDQMYRVNDSFISSFAFRDPNNLLPGTHFIMTQKCGLVDPKTCANEE